MTSFAVDSASASADDTKNKFSTGEIDDRNQSLNQETYSQIQNQVVFGMITPIGPGFQPAITFPQLNSIRTMPYATIVPIYRMPIPLALESDASNLPPYQCLLREQIELFATSNDDISIQAQGRQTPIRLGQVGIRCHHCAETTRFTRGAILYSRSINGIYQVAMNMGRLHFLNGSCAAIPEQLKNHLMTLHESMSHEKTKKRKYWKESLEAQGVIEDSNCLLFHHIFHQQPQQPTSHIPAPRPSASDASDLLPCRYWTVWNKQRWHFNQRSRKQYSRSSWARFEVGMNPAPTLLEEQQWNLTEFWTTAPHWYRFNHLKNHLVEFHITYSLVFVKPASRNCTQCCCRWWFSLVDGFISNNKRTTTAKSWKQGHSEYSNEQLSASWNKSPSTHLIQSCTSIRRSDDVYQGFGSATSYDVVPKFRSGWREN